ncbi:hypothetical protein MNBD_NITROSPINAE02-1794 [hydrothermal vent metagenome]|uniref:Uncharacterized protein n=1 Tax=hydrothermal vent metagenome TaxID=652676 RepID=A0A3B1CIJ6_9ZZZZ
MREYSAGFVYAIMCDATGRQRSRGGKIIYKSNWGIFLAGIL